MMLFKIMDEENKRIKEEGREKLKEIQEKNICPTCYNMKYGGIYPSFKERIIYENYKIVCFLEQYPRNPGHTIIPVKNHYEDISEIPDDIGKEVMNIIPIIIKALKRTINAEKVYLCTMCDGKRNHLHFQLIPRLKNDEIIGSKLFVKERGILVLDKEILSKIIKYINEEVRKI